MKNLISLFDRNTILHLRLPFSFFLLPVFCFAISQTEAIDLYNTIIIFLALHFFIYPGSNIYNSYMDKDTKSIGGLKNPPPVTKNLYYVSIIFDLGGLLICLLISKWMLPMMALYILISKAYSWKGIRLKKYPVTGWLVVMLFQGGYTFLLVNMAATNRFDAGWFTLSNLMCMLIASLLIGGYYPLTQIYQHDEDSRRGDMTISFKLGIIGTFIFSGLIFLFACFTSWYYFTAYFDIRHFVIFMVCLAPVIVYFTFWLAKTLSDKAMADYKHAMQMTLISSCCLIICFSILLFINHA